MVRNGTYELFSITVLTVAHVSNKNHGEEYYYCTVISPGLEASRCGGEEEALGM